MESTVGTQTLDLRLAQAAAMPALVALRMAQWLAPFFTYHFFTGDPGDSVARAIAASVAVFLLATLAEFAIAIAGKWLIAGRLKAGSTRGAGPITAGGWPTGWWKRHRPICCPVLR
jgi:hypothetical protein